VNPTARIRRKALHICQEVTLKGHWSDLQVCIIQYRWIARLGQEGKNAGVERGSWLLLDFPIEAAGKIMMDNGTIRVPRLFLTGEG
jgi:hypothetical protein